MKKTITTERVPIKLWLEDIEPGALKQARDLANLTCAFRWIAIMPDCHQGFGMPIGGVLASEGAIIPNAVGVDIGCGMYAAQTSLTDIAEDALRRVLSRIRGAIPLGFEHHKSDQAWQGFEKAPDSPIIQQELASARRQLGTLGGGNHFIEIQEGEDGHVWAMLHSGSRNFGLKTAEYYHNKARALCQAKQVELPTPDLAYLRMDTPDGREYFDAMSYCCEFARANRALMMRRVLDILADETGAACMQEINIHHNYAAMETHYGREVLVHRKGATRAAKDTIGIIPGSMGTPSYIVQGMGNPESFESCAHGAGRRMGRNEARRSLDLEGEQKKMNGILHGLRSKSGLDEAPGAYKDIQQVMADQVDLVKISVTLKPLASIKG